MTQPVVNAIDSHGPVPTLAIETSVVENLLKLREGKQRTRSIHLPIFGLEDIQPMKQTTLRVHIYL